MLTQKFLVALIVMSSSLTTIAYASADFAPLTEGYVRDANAVVIGTGYEKLSSFQGYKVFVAQLKKQYGDIVATAGLTTLPPETDGTVHQRTRINIYSRNAKGVLLPIGFVNAYEIPGDEFNLGRVVDLQFGKINQ